MTTEDAQNETLNSVAAEESLSPDQSKGVVDGDEPRGIGGILIFVAAGLSLSLLQNLGYCLAALAPIIRMPLWESLTDPVSPAYHPNWKPVLVYEAVTSSLILLTNLVMLWLFLRKKRIFPKLIVILIPLIFGMSLGGYYLSGFIPAVAESQEYAKQGHNLIVKFVSLHIWIPYFLVSKRVSSTFVR